MTVFTQRETLAVILGLNPRTSWESIQEEVTELIKVQEHRQTLSSILTKGNRTTLNWDAIVKATKKAMVIIDDLKQKTGSLTNEEYHDSIAHPLKEDTHMSEVKKCFRDLDRDCIGEQCMAYALRHDDIPLPGGCVFIASASMAGLKDSLTATEKINELEVNDTLKDLGGFIRKMILERVQESQAKKSEKKP